MNSSVKMILILTVTAMLSGGILSAWEGFTAPKIAFHKQEAIKQAVREVLPEYDTYETKTVGDQIYYVGKKEGQADPVGIAYRAIGAGFQGKITVMVGSEPGLNKITGIKVLEHAETPGLGTKIITDPSNKQNPSWFPDQFKGVDTTGEIRVVKNQKPSRPDEIQAISGATISSRSVVKLINNYVAKAKGDLGTAATENEAPVQGEIDGQGGSK